LVWKPAQTKYVMPAINSKKIYKKFAVVAYVLQSTQSLVISRCCFAEDGYEIFITHVQSRCSAH